MSAMQLPQLEEWCKANGRPATDVKMLRIDQLAELGCCKLWVFAQAETKELIRQGLQAASARSCTCKLWLSVKALLFY
jgi:hypothetical protein